MTMLRCIERGYLIRYRCQKKGRLKMKYVILVSHGNFAEGLLDSLKMLTGNHDDVIAIGLKDGITADQFAIDFTEIITKIPKESEIIVLADIIGGSPL